MTTIQTTFAALKSEMTAIQSNIREVNSANANRRTSIAKLANAPGVTDFMSAESLQTLSVFANFIGFDIKKTATAILVWDWDTFSKQFSL